MKVFAQTRDHCTADRSEHRSQPMTSNCRYCLICSMITAIATVCLFTVLHCIIGYGTWYGGVPARTWSKHFPCLPPVCIVPPFAPRPPGPHWGAICTIGIFRAFATVSTWRILGTLPLARDVSLRSAPWRLWCTSSQVIVGINWVATVLLCAPVLTERKSQTEQTGRKRLYHG